MRRAERKLELSNKVVGKDNETQGPGKDAGAEAGDMRSLIFGLRTFDPREMSTGHMSAESIVELNAMAEKVVEMRKHTHSDKDGHRFEINPNKLLNRDNLLTGTADIDKFDPGLDEASYRSWVENFKEESKRSESSTLELGRRRCMSEETVVKREADKKKAEQKQLAKWQSLGYQSSAVKVPDLITDNTILSDSGSVQYVYGDCTKPEKVRLREPALIFR